MNSGRVLCRLGIVFALAYLAYHFTFIGAQPDQGRVLARTRHDDGVNSVTLVSQPYRLDKVYKSMSGPSGNQPHIRLLENTAPDEVVWLTGLDTEVVNADTLAPLSTEYFCHSNLTFDPTAVTPEQHNASFSPPTHGDWRLFTLIPGRMSLRLPDGFGIPVHAGASLDNFTMSLNQNPGHPDQRVRMKTTIRFRPSSEAGAMRPLFRRGVYVYQQHRETAPAGNVVETMAGKGHQGENCAESCPGNRTGATPSEFLAVGADGSQPHPGASCCVANASPEGVLPQFGSANTVHWMVPPGKHLYRSEVTAQMDLPFDTTVHYVTGHLHPYGSALKLIDLETGTAVFEITAGCYADRLGVNSMSEISSVEGIPVFRGRRYELVAEYDNTSTDPIDAMAILYFYARDQLSGTAHPGT